ncbi:MAG: DsbA family protein [Gammaproteobacteria bacterium]|nr:DsbA family protein [Gammaproteobacteria bacterium]
MLQPLVSERPAIVYIDFKSPYAYLAIQPTRELERELGMRFDWRPFVLDIPSYLGSARLDERGEVTEQQRSAEQWAGVKYAYHDCRRYARLQGRTIRGTEKIWDTHLVATAMLWVRQYGDETLHRFLDRVFPPFWVRELDVEDEQVIAGLLDDLDADGPGFLSWAHAEGLAENAQFQSAAFEAGIFGVPTWVVGEERYFGREHLPRIRWHLTGEKGPAPDIANPLPSPLPEPPPLPDQMYIGVDDSVDSLLALPRLMELLADYDGTVDWIRIAPEEPPAPPPEDDLSRSAMHQRWRARNRAADVRRYDTTGTTDESRPGAIDEYLQEHGIKPADDGPAEVVRPALPGIVILLGEERFIGRQHLPLLAARMRRTQGDPR